ncbi:hypothetical protein CSA37_06115 [Candidatus Fermentibacteria bacterium]|nr:MAG: hypothetical protein CSA37_06115 [Candidatus Fermentibacteria bacterium]
MVRKSFVCIVMGLAILAAGCGGAGELGSIGGEPVTEEQYLEVFNGLPAEEQVSVLEPGGRMELMERIVRKKLLLAAWAEDTSVSGPWEELYTVSVLSDSMFRRIAMEFDAESYIDSLSSTGYSSFSLRAVLFADSSEAVQLAEQWNTGNFDQTVPSVSAPWSNPSTESSYRFFSGPLHTLTPVFLPLLEMEHGTAHVLPMFGQWGVGLLELEEGEWVSDESAPGIGLMNLVGVRSGEKLLAAGIRELAGNCAVSGTVLVPAGEGSSTPVAVAGTDTITVSDFLEVMEMASPSNFFGGVPEELAAFSPPELTFSPEITIWFYARSVAQRFALAESASAAGVQIPSGTLDYARAESVVRDRVLKPSIPDSAEVALWYEQNTDMFVLPERRSVLLGYTEGSLAETAPSSFEQLDQLQTIVDEDGEMVATPAQFEVSFGEILGPEIFQAEPGVFSGPVQLDGELAAWFQVVEIVPSGVAALDEIYPVAVSAAANQIFSEGFETLISDLRSSYPVVVDTAAVVEIDLWGGMR